MALAFHTDAGVRTDSTVVGTLGLYSTDGGQPLGNGTSRYANRDLTAAVTSQVVSDIRRTYDPGWTSRGNRDKRYYEVRETKVPVLFILGRKDDYIPVEAAEKMVAEHPEAQIVWLEHAGHMGFLEEREAAAGALLDFVGAAREA